MQLAPVNTTWKWLRRKQTMNENIVLILLDNCEELFSWRIKYLCFSKKGGLSYLFLNWYLFKNYWNGNGIMILFMFSLYTTTYLGSLLFEFGHLYLFWFPIFGIWTPLAILVPYFWNLDTFGKLWSIFIAFGHL